MSEPVKINYDRLSKWVLAEIKSNPLGGVIITNPSLLLAYLAYKAVKGFFDTSRFTEDDSHNIAEIIKSGRENGVSEMEIISKKLTGVDLKFPNVDADVNVTIGMKNETIIKVKYK